nr:RecName: Full=27 kDa cell wall protein [Arabidopsis thaliana]
VDTSRLFLTVVNNPPTVV